MQRTHILGKNPKFSAQGIRQETPGERLPEAMGLQLCWAMVSCGVGRLISDADFKEAEWLDELPEYVLIMLIMA